MSNVKAAIEVADQLVSRLFNHRHFTNGEIAYLMREFGEKANLEENFDRLLKISENFGIISDTYNENMCKPYDDVIQNVCVQAKLLEEKAERILRIENEQRKKEAEQLVKPRADREKLRQDCYKKTISKLEKLSESLMEEELELERKYLLFEENLTHH